MSTLGVPNQTKTEAQTALSKAVIRASERLGLRNAALARILGLSPPTISRLTTGRYELDPSRKEWEFALLLIRVFRSLDSIVGDEFTARAWLKSPNLGLNGCPIELIETTEGLVRVAQYLDAHRGRI